MAEITDITDLKFRRDLQALYDACMSGEPSEHRFTRRTECGECRNGYEFEVVQTISFDRLPIPVNEDRIFYAKCSGHIQQEKFDKAGKSVGGPFWRPPTD